MVFAISAVAPGTVVLASDTEELTIWAGRYTPSRTMAAVGSGIKGRDIKGIDPIIEAYQELHPNVKINVLGQSINSDTRQWMITNLTAETAPEIAKRELPKPAASLPAVAAVFLRPLQWHRGTGLSFLPGYR